MKPMNITLPICSLIWLNSCITAIWAHNTPLALSNGVVVILLIALFVQGNFGREIP